MDQMMYHSYEQTCGVTELGIALAKARRRAEGTGALPDVAGRAVLSGPGTEFVLAATLTVGSTLGAPKGAHGDPELLEVPLVAASVAEAGDE